MKIACLLLAASLAAVHAEQLFDLSKELTKTVNTTKAPSGAIVETTTWDNHSDRKITFPTTKFVDDWHQQADFINRMTEHIRDRKKVESTGQSADQPIYDCLNRMGNLQPGQELTWFPVFIAELNNANPSSVYTSSCFGTFNMDFALLSETQFQVTVTLGNKKGLTCHDTLLFANTEAWHAETFYFNGSHVLTFDMPGLIEQQDVGFTGINVFMSCYGIEKETESILRMMEMMIDVNRQSYEIPDYMANTDRQFLLESMGYDLPPRPINFVDIDENMVKSGDFFGVTRLDGLNPLIMYGTGSHIGHCTTALRFDDGLYIVESQGAAFWPVQGIQRTPFAQWIQQTRERDMAVIWLPLSDEAAARYDLDKARAYFYSMEGLPYGYHNFLFGWIDTFRDNLPPLMPNELLPIVGSMAEQFMPQQIYKSFSAGLNMRMGTENLTIAQLAALGAQQGLQIQDIMAIPEQDAWTYYDGKSFVCSSFVAGIWHAGGIYGDIELNGTEQTPPDVYRMNFFDKNFQRPQQCIDADPDLPYCQLNGKYRITIQLDQWSTIEPYNNMNEHCTSLNPLYLPLPAGC